MDVYVGDGDVVKMINQNRYGDHKNPNAHEWVLKSDVEALEQEVELLKWAYCEAVGADSIVGLDCCDNYKDWLIGLSRLRQGE